MNGSQSCSGQGGDERRSVELAKASGTGLADALAAIIAACRHLSDGNVTAAKEAITLGYPLDTTSCGPCGYTGSRIQEPLLSVKPKRRAPTPMRLAELHARDGYVDRYTGRRLVSPIVLRLLGHETEGPLRDVLPYHVNGGRGGPARHGGRAVCHQAGFELYATYEHVRPVRVGGGDVLGNAVTCSVDVNYEKGVETWAPAFPPGNLADWDGLTSWFLEYTAANDCTWLHGLAQWRRALMTKSSASS